ncbi:phage tail sheath C-terminal domain-containing protein [Arenimonas sp.]|uniref:phage tail sheath family protein n=1 Tax=Arenimonas sp. TaxID=1872635 RepID=UPI0025BF6246|nr:phage tail sheath C-terminal domain-containing protein [Arenimonas sp.]
MPDQPGYPGVYVEEVPGGVRGIASVPTSVAAFVGRAWRGPVDQAISVGSYREFERIFGGLWAPAPMSRAVRQFFNNGGGVARVVRVATRVGAGQASPARIELGNGLALAAADPGTWGRNLVAVLTPQPGDPQDPTRFSLEVHDDPDRHRDASGQGGSGIRELHTGLSLDPGHARHCGAVLARDSMLVRLLHAPDSLSLPDAAPQLLASADPTSGHDGLPIGAGEVSDVANEAAGTGLYALGEGAGFNLLCIPPFAPEITNNGIATWRAAAALCRSRRALLLIDAPADATVGEAIAFTLSLAPIEAEWAAVYHPWLWTDDPSAGHGETPAAPGGFVAGLLARVDAQRGVWKAPAGLEAGLRGARGLALAQRPGGPTEDDLASLNAAGICALRTLPGRSEVVAWGARTLAGAADSGSEWKYIPVRRTAAMIETALVRGTTWTVFEANDERLWAQLRLSVGSYLHSLFLAGAFAGSTAREAYFVRCGADTHAARDIAQGRVNLQIGVALVRPAEFVMLRPELRAIADP